MTTASETREDRDGAERGWPAPDVAAIYTTVLAAMLVLTVVMWLLRLFVFAGVPAGRYTALMAVAAGPAVLVVTWPGPPPQRLLFATFAVFSLVITTGIHFGGGPDNVSGPLLYTVVVGLAGQLVSGRAAYGVAGGSGALYGLMVLGERLDYLPHHLPYSKSDPDALATVVSVALYLLLVAWVVSSAARQIQATHQRLEELRTEAVSALSHDLRSPLGAIRSYAELAETLPPHEVPQYLRHIRRAAQHALDLVSNVLDAAALAARPMIPDCRPLQMNDLVSETSELYGAAAESKGITLRVSLASDLPPVAADAHLMRRVVSNLLSNAIKFTDAGGRVEVATEAADDGRVRLIVRDTGCGIAARDRVQLFQKYRRGRSTAHLGGTGLGLYIVRSIVDAHAGEVSVESTPGAGATFTVELPVAR